MVFTNGDSLVGADCERVGAAFEYAARPRLSLRSATSPFLLALPACTVSCESATWVARAKGRVVASAGPEGAPASLGLNASGRRLLGRKRTLQVRVEHTQMISPIHGGDPSPHRDGFRMDLRLR